MTLMSAPRIGLAGRDMVYLQLTGVPTLYADTPDTPALSITGNISLRARVALDDWTPTLTNTIVAKEDDASARSYHLSVDTDGTILLMLSEDGATFDHINSDTVAGFSDAAPGWIRADADLADSLVTFYTGGAGRVPVWTQLGDPVATTEASIDDNASAVQIGRTLAGLEATDGKIFRVQIYDDETLVFDANFDEPKNEGAATITENASGATVTLQGAASLDSQASQAAGDYELLRNANQAAAGFVDRDTGPALFFDDDLIDSESATLQSHTPAPIGTSWVQHASFGTNLIFDSNNRVYANSGVECRYYASDDPASADYTVESLCYCYTDGSFFTHIMGRAATGADTCYTFGRTGFSVDDWALAKIVAGSETPLDAASEAISTSTPYTLKLVMVGDVLEGYVNGVLKCSATDSDISAAGKAGIRGRQSGGGNDLVWETFKAY